MLYSCFACRRQSFTAQCPQCGSNSNSVPLDAAYYPEFQYWSQGALVDLFVKDAKVKELSNKLGGVLERYRQLEKPYFINYVHMVGRSSDGVDPASDPNLHLLNAVLLRCGFSELSAYPQLLAKLVRTTAFRFQYGDFRKRFMDHVVMDNLPATMRSYIEEVGPTFRQTAEMVLYTFWTEGAFRNQVRFQVPNAHTPLVPLVQPGDVAHFMKNCEGVYWELQVDRLQRLLEHFEQERYVTIFDIDSLTGFQFEDFLVTMFRTLGYAVDETKRTGDQGADLFVTRFGLKTVIQAKNYSDNVGNGAVQQALAAKSFYGADHAMVVANRYFTPSAKELAAATGVRLVDRNELQVYLDDYNRELVGAEAPA